MSPHDKDARALDMNNLPKAISPTQAQKVLGIGKDLWYDHVAPAMARREFLWYRIGRKKRIITASLLAWQEERARREAVA